MTRLADKLRTWIDGVREDALLTEEEIKDMGDMPYCDMMAGLAKGQHACTKEVEDILKDCEK